MAEQEICKDWSRQTKCWNTDDVNNMFLGFSFWDMWNYVNWKIINMLITYENFEKQIYYPSDFVFCSLLLCRIPVFSAYTAETLMMWTVVKSAFQVDWLKASVWIMPEAPGI